MTDKLLPNGEDVPLFPVDAPTESAPPDLEAEREKLHADNVSMLQALAQQGMNFDPPMLVIQLKMRLDMITELLVHADFRPAFEYSYEAQLNQMLQAAVRDAVLPKLLDK